MPTTTPIAEADRPLIRELTIQHWHAPHICVRGQLYEPHEAQGLICREGNDVLGWATYLQDGDSLLLITQNSTQPGAKIGSSLLLRVIEEARKNGVRRLWLTTTNDNLKSLGFYQRMGFRMVRVHPNAVNEAREGLKPEVPQYGRNGLAIQDEIEMELLLEPYSC